MLMLRLVTLGSLNLLGEIDIESDKRRQASVATQRKPMALMCVVAAAGLRGVSREQVLLYLWPESTPDSARNTLNQTLYALKKNLGEPELFIPGNTLKLNPEVFSCDLWDFEKAIARRDTEAAVEQ